MKPLTYLLVDFENLQPPAKDVALVRGEEYCLLIFRGPHQNKYDAAMAEAWQPLGQQVSFVQSAKAGKNALDFHIAFCLGRLCEVCAVAQRPARFIVVSKDCGFNPLFEYMAFSLGASVGRAPSIPMALDVATRLKAAVPGSNGLPLQPLAAGAAPSAPQQSPFAVRVTAKKAAKKTAKTVATRPKSTAQPVADTGALEKVIEYLRAHPNNRPTTRKALERHFPSIVGEKLAAEAINELILKLEGNGIAQFLDKGIEYKIPKRK